MMRRPSTAGLLLLVALAGCDRSSSAVDPERGATPPVLPAQPAETPSIDLQRMLTDIAYLADDAMMGRDTRKLEDIRKAARYIADSHRAAGVRPAADDFLVDFDLEVDTTMARDVHLWLERDGSSTALSSGYVVARTKWNGEPAFGPVAEVPVTTASPKGAADHLLLLRATTSLLDDATQLRSRVDALLAAGGRAVIIVLPQGASLPEPSAADTMVGGASGPVLFMLDDVARKRLPWGDRPLRGSKARALPNVRVSMAPKEDPVIEARPNVLAVIPGTDLSDQLVVLGAHYDHIGREDDGVFCTDPGAAPDPEDGICNGADDNASGTAMVMEIARAIAGRGRRPRRTVVFAHFSGEELGLRGSQALVDAFDRTPPFDHAQVVAMLNMDMVGRYRDDPGLSIGAVSTSDGWGALLDSVDPRGLVVVREPSVNSRSDHAPFHRKGIPVLFFFTGLHVDYHRTSDELAAINGDGMNRIAQIVLDVTLALADGHSLAPAQPRAAALADGDAPPDDLP